MTAGGYLATLQDLLARQGGHPVARRALATRLIALLSATGLRMRALEGRAWAEFVTDAEPHGDNARHFASIAEAANPLAATRHAPPLIRQRIHRRLEGWWRRQRRRAGFQHLPADLSAVTWDLLPARNQAGSPKDDIRTAIRDLASYERGQSGRGRPFKGDQDAALLGLAEVFIDFTGSDAHPLDLPHSPGGRFIGFAEAALRPYLAATEGSADALSHRWRRAKEQARDVPA